MGQIICITNLKGGSGKTTTALNLAASLAVAEKKTLLIDCDPQGNATVGLGIDKRSIKSSLYHAMIDNSISEDLIKDSDLDFLKIIPGRIELLRVEIKLSSTPGKETILKNILADIKDQFDYMIIDSSPSLGLLTTNSLVAADSFLVPLPCEFYALEGFGHILKAIKIIKNTFNPDLKMLGTLLTMYDGSEFSKKIAEEVRARLKHKVFKTVVPWDQKIKESPFYGMSILSQDISSSGSAHYLNLAGEIINL